MALSREILQLSNDLDKIGGTKYSDLLFKTAFDVSEYTERNNLVGQGAFGSFYSNFDKNISKKISREPNVGLKVFHEGNFDNYFTDNVREFLTFKYIAPLIARNTKFKVPRAEDQSLSSFLHNKSIVSQKVPGVSIGNSGVEVLDHTFGYEKTFIASEMPPLICDFIESVLNNKVGVSWYDCGARNYLFGPMAVKTYKNAINELYEYYIAYNNGQGRTQTIEQVINDWGEFYINEIYDTGQIYIVDFGLMAVIPHGEAVKKLEKFYQQLLDVNMSRNNVILEEILKITDRMINGKYY